MRTLQILGAPEVWTGTQTVVPLEACALPGPAASGVSGDWNPSPAVVAHRDNEDFLSFSSRAPSHTVRKAMAGLSGISR